jgi:hypothetical protein
MPALRRGVFRDRAPLTELHDVLSVRRIPASGRHGEIVTPPPIARNPTIEPDSSDVDYIAGPAKVATATAFVERFDSENRSR